jgi:hypothetical protein
VAGLIGDSSSPSTPATYPIEFPLLDRELLGQLQCSASQKGGPGRWCCRGNAWRDDVCCAGKWRARDPCALWAAWAACCAPASPLFVGLMSAIWPDSEHVSCFCVSFCHGSETLESSFDMYRQDPGGQMTPRSRISRFGAPGQTAWPAPFPAERALFLVES